MENKPQAPLFFRSLTGRVFYGWWILFMSSVALIVGAGILGHGFTVFFLPLKRDLAVSSAAVSLLYGAARLEGGVEGPFIGYLIDRFGPRALMIFGAVLSGVGLILLSQVESFTSFFFVYIFIVATGYNAGVYHPVYALVNSWFIRHRGFGFAMTGVASSLGGMIMAPLLSYLVLDFGWRTGAVISGLMILAIVLPVSLSIRRSPESMGLVPDGDPPPEDSPAESGRKAARVSDLDFTVREALRTFNYWLLFSAITLRVLVTTALTIHFIPILVWKGLGEGASAYMVSLYAFSTIALTLVTGWIGDRLNKPLICSVGVLGMVLGMLAMMVSDSPLSRYALPLGLALTMGTVPLNWALIGDYFGRKHYGTLRGIVGVGTGLGTFLSPIYAGFIYDRAGSYFYVLLTFTASLLLALAFFALLSRRAPQKNCQAARS